MKIHIEPRVRDRAIEKIISNLIMAGVLLREEVAAFMVELANYHDIRLGITLIESRKLFVTHLADCRNRN